MNNTSLKERRINWGKSNFFKREKPGVIADNAQWVLYRKGKFYQADTLTELMKQLLDKNQDKYYIG